MNKNTKCLKENIKLKKIQVRRVSLIMKQNRRLINKTTVNICSHVHGNRSERTYTNLFKAENCFFFLLQNLLYYLCFFPISMCLLPLYSEFHPTLCLSVAIQKSLRYNDNQYFLYGFLTWSISNKVTLS